MGGSSKCNDFAELCSYTSRCPRLRVLSLDADRRDVHARIHCRTVSVLTTDFAEAFVGRRELTPPGRQFDTKVIDIPMSL